jgi:ribosome biogenesis GTPase / thiamine phosphate phosphatase
VNNTTQPMALATHVTASNVSTATVMADYGKRTLVWFEGRIQAAAPRRVSLRCVVGDVVDVELDPTSNTLWLAKVHPRRNALYRADITKQKCFAANLDVVFLVLASQPAPLLDLLARTLVACHAADLPVHVVLNKSDLPDFRRLDHLASMLDFASISHTALTTQSKDSVDTLRPALNGKRCLILGQSGVGKSSLINVLVPDAQAQTRALSDATLTGRHTTTSSYLYQAGDFEVIDSPGFQNFGLTHVPPHQWIEAFTTLTPHIINCRFYNCTHRHEPNCGVINALGEGRNQAWYDLLKGLHDGPRAGVNAFSGIPSTVLG